MCVFVFVFLWVEGVFVLYEGRETLLSDLGKQQGVRVNLEHPHCKVNVFLCLALLFYDA